MTKTNRLKLIEISMLVLIWLALLASPILFRTEENISWEGLIGPLLTFAPLFILFLINRLLLLPKLLFKDRHILYFISVGGIIAVFTLTIFFLPFNRGEQAPPNRIDETRMQRPPEHHIKMDAELPPSRPEPQHGRPMPPFANFLIFSILLVGFDIGLRVSFKLAETERARARLEKENVGTQLAFLRNQVSPHFFMNTLNNIHSLIDIDTEEAKESIIRLSKLMRHLLYDSEIEKIPIQKEIDFVKNYIDLMKLRYSDKVAIGLQLPEQLPQKSIPPLLFTSFVENAFKHGISYQNSSYINIAFSWTDENLTFEIKNSISKAESKDKDSGIGLENARKRLDLIYGDYYSLEIIADKEEHYVRLSIPI